MPLVQFIPRKNICLVASLLLCLHFFCQPALSEERKPASIETATPAARVVSLNGQAFVEKRKLKPGDTLRVGEIVRTREKASVKLLMPDDTIVDLGSSTVFRVEKFVANNTENREVSLKLDLGRARTSIHKKLNRKGKFLIRTKASVLAVRGTEVFLDILEQQGGGFQESVTVGEGTVNLSLQGQPQTPSLTLTPGNQFQVSGSADTDGAINIDPQITTQPRTAMTQVRNIATVQNQYQVQDNTFQQNVVVEETAEDDAMGGGNATLTLVQTELAAPATGGATKGETEEAETEAPAIDPTEIINEHIPNADGSSASGGLNQTPGVGGNNTTGSTAGNGSTGGQPDVGTEANNVNVRVTFETNSTN